MEMQSGGLSVWLGELGGVVCDLGCGLWSGEWCGELGVWPGILRVWPVLWGVAWGVAWGAGSIGWKRVSHMIGCGHPWLLWLVLD